MKHKFSRLLMTLVALFAMTTGAWAQEGTLLTTILSTGDNASFISGSKTFDNIATVTFSGEVYNEGGEGGWCSNKGITLTVTAAEGYTITRVKFYNMSGSAFDEEAPFEAILDLNGVLEDITKVNGTSIGEGGVTKIEVYGYADTPAGPEVTWDAATKTGTFDMPASNVVLTPEFAPVAQWATESDVELLPTAAEGIFAGTTDPLIVEGTVAPGQGIVMYAVTSTNQATAPELSAFSATVPTAENIADEGADVLVWYYIQGADAPDGQEATAENTFNDSEICATPLEVSVLSNKFDITFNAANANTIEAGKATVTVGGTAATVTEGKLEGVKMGSEVKMTAKQGYKFRKVEVKKAAARPLAEAVAADLGKIAGADGNIYDTKAAAEAAGTTAVAMIAYVGSETGHATYTHGLAIALADEGSMNWSTAESSCEGKSAVTNAAWLMPSQNQWKAMFKAFGDNDASYSGLNTAITTAGGDDSKLQVGKYWTSTLFYGGTAYNVDLGSNGNASPGLESMDYSYQVRACLAF